MSNNLVINDKTIVEQESKKQNASSLEKEVDKPKRFTFKC